ncbi:MAG: hypothetical protein ACMG6S_07915 [Byssovorax sp.]
MAQLRTAFVSLAVVLASCTSPTATYDDVAPLPRDEQLAAFASASPTEKAAIYRGHFERLAAREGVTAEQRAALLRSAALVSPDWYDLAPSAPGWAERVQAPRDEMERITRAAFGERASRITMAIGPE